MKNSWNWKEIFEDNKSLIKYLLVEWWIKTIIEIVNKIWIKFNNLEEKRKIENNLNEYLEKENLSQYLKQKEEEKKQTNRNFWQFKNTIKELVLEWKNSIEILEELWYNTWFFDQRSLQQYVRKHLWLNVTKRTTKWMKWINSIEENRFEKYNKDELEKFVLESKNFKDLYRNIWINENNKRLKNELFEKLDELNIDYSNLSWRSSSEWSYNFMNHIDTIKECLKEWKDLSEILKVIWIEETQHSRKLLRKFIKNKERLMNIKLETTWTTYKTDLNNRIKNDFEKEIKEKLDIQEFEIQWREKNIFELLDSIDNDKLIKILKNSNTYAEVKENIPFLKKYKFKEIKHYFIDKWFSKYITKFEIWEYNERFENNKEKIIELIKQWANRDEILKEIWFETFSRKIKENFKFFLDTNNIEFHEWDYFEIDEIFEKEKDYIKNMIELWIKKYEIINFIISKIIDQTKYTNLQKLLYNKIKYFIKRNKIKTWYIEYWKIYTYNDKEKLEEVCMNSNSYIEAIQMYWYQYNMNSKSHFKKAIVRYWIDISHFKSIQMYWNKNFIMTKQKIKEEKKKKITKKLINTIINTLCVWSTKQTKDARHFINKYWLLENKCQKCWLSWTYNWKEIVLQLDHIDWDDHNHSLNNLRFLCPNCHSQTETYCSKNVWRVHKPNTWKVDNTLKKFLDEQFSWWSEIEEFKKYL